MLAKLTTTVSRTAMRQAMRPIGARFMSQRYTKSHEWVKVRHFNAPWLAHHCHQ